MTKRLFICCVAAILLSLVHVEAAKCAGVDVFLAFKTFGKALLLVHKFSPLNTRKSDAKYAKLELAIAGKIFKAASKTCITDNQALQDDFTTATEMATSNILSQKKTLDILSTDVANTLEAMCKVTGDFMVGSLNDSNNLAGDVEFIYTKLAKITSLDYACFGLTPISCTSFTTVAGGGIITTAAGGGITTTAAGGGITTTAAGGGITTTRAAGGGVTTTTAAGGGITTTTTANASTIATGSGTEPCTDPDLTANIIVVSDDQVYGYIDALEWKLLGQLPRPLEFSSVVSLDCWIYVMSDLSFIDYYATDTGMRAWLSMRANTVRKGASAVVLARKMYVVGGWTTVSYFSPSSSSTSYYEQIILSDTEIFDLSRTEWDGVLPADMNKVRVFHKVVELNGELYALGGCTFGACAEVDASVEKYNFQTNQWTFVSSMLSTRYLHSAVQLNGRIYVFGGRDASYQYLSDAEMYLPETDEWVSIAPLPYPLARAQAVVVDNRIMAIGGGDELGPTGRVLEYDPDTDTWTPGIDTGLPQINFNGVVKMY